MVLEVSMEPATLPQSAPAAVEQLQEAVLHPSGSAVSSLSLAEQLLAPTPPMPR